jgi:hypothetical protein
VIPGTLAPLWVASQVNGILWAPLIRTLGDPWGSGTTLGCFPAEWIALGSFYTYGLSVIAGALAPLWVALQVNGILWAPLIRTLDDP